MENRIENFLSQLTLEEKISLLSGSSSMKTRGIERLGIPELEMSDGPQGVRGIWEHAEERTTALPCGMALAATFDTNTAEEYGRAIALDCRAMGISGSLGPGMNLMRTPLCGRNFEYYGEDPVLAGRIAAGYIRGCQQENVAATPKHLALNNQEICRTVGSSDIDERTLRELYLTAFEIAVKEGHPWMMMSSYNRINGTFASENGITQDLIVKREWGFDGVMVSDWGGAHDTLGCALGGLDLEMPGPGNVMTVEKLLSLVRSGAVPESVIDDKVRRILRLLCRTGVLDGLQKKGKTADAEQLATALKCACESSVLLKNDGGLLPLDIEKCRKIVVTGPNVEHRHHHGKLRYQGGSGAVLTGAEITPLAGLQKFAAENGIDLEYIPTCRFENDLPDVVELFRDKSFTSAYYPSEEAMKDHRDLIFEHAGDRGDWEFATIDGLVAGNDTGGVKLSADSFILHASAVIEPEDPVVRHVRIHLLSQGAGCSVKLDGREVCRVDSSGFAGCFDLDLAGCRGSRLDIEYISKGILFANSLKVVWEDLDVYAENMQKLLTAAKYADAVIFIGGRTHLDDKETIGWGDVQAADIRSLELPVRQDPVIQALSQMSSSVIVTLTGGGTMDVEKWIDDIPALMMLWYPGETAGNALASLLFGKADPGGRLPFTWAVKLEDYPCHANGSYPGNRTDADPHVQYKEGIFVGYRHFDRENIPVRFPFGYGLSYSKFAVELLKTECTGNTVFDAGCEVAVKIINVSERTGSEVIQIYVGAVEPEFPRPVKELKAFAKVELAPGETKEVMFKLNWRDFACFHPDKHHWCLPAGKYRIFLAGNAADVKAVADVQFKEL
ncbi:MAG: hypothetical protein E7057_09410 [Lentisphaerae bacterium]|nr:hypothetical protein [Lentisphaerota bacterium]